MMMTPKKTTNSEMKTIMKIMWTVL